MRLSRVRLVFVVLVGTVALVGCSNTKGAAIEACSDHLGELDYDVEGSVAIEESEDKYNVTLYADGTNTVIGECAVEEDGSDFLVSSGQW